MLDQPIDTLSKGFKRRVGLAQAILHDPPVLIMDEPTDGLDPNQKHAVRALIRGMAPEKAIIVSTHLLEEVEAICTRAVIIDRGRIVADGTPAQLLARSRHHNAVTLHAAGRSSAAAVAAKLEVAAGVSPPSSKRTQRRRLATITAFPRRRRAADRGRRARWPRAENWDVKELYAEAGRLDEVFRAITTHDAHAARESRA